ncbi:GNAT family N-acetyltransferase [Nocardioides campestrisoli]|uniref:GNAT family N-acetyltransferase n=1 Tax=Nocardioides campestrisoli TaxID=2736757 RepID=UPI0015E6A63A|nr:GNAT family N-acetyltransferase [Nocardioides campestrisoli]
MTGVPERGTTSGEVGQHSRTVHPSATDVRIRPPDPAELGATAALLGLAMADNPLHVAAYGDDETTRARRHTHLMRGVVGRRRGEIVLAAFHDFDVVGAVAVTPTPGCRPRPLEVLRLVPGLARTGPGSLARVLVWQRAWSAHHPGPPHLHVGPLAVHPAWRGRGLGGELLLRALAEGSRRHPGLPAYLETDREANVGFYRRLGFVLVDDGPVLGLPNWFMERATGDHSAAQDFTAQDFTASKDSETVAGREGVRSWSGCS